MTRIEEIRRRCIATLDERNLQGVHEPGRRHPKVVAGHDDALHALAITLAESLDELTVLLPALGLKPLLKLVEDDQDLLACRDEAATTQSGQGFNESQFALQIRAVLTHRLQQPGLRL